MPTGFRIYRVLDKRLDEKTGKWLRVQGDPSGYVVYDESSGKILEFFDRAHDALLHIEKLASHDFK